MSLYQRLGLIAEYRDISLNLLITSFPQFLYLSFLDGSAYLAFYGAEGF